MNLFEKDTIYLVGDSRTSKNNPITAQFNSFFITLIIRTSDGLIMDAGVSTMLEETKVFIKSIFIGHSMEEEPQIVIDEINQRYFGSSQKALIVAWKDAVKKYKAIKNKSYRA